jgi:hypothetical protein
VKGVEALYLYKGLDSIGSLKAAIERVRPDLIVPGDDGVVWQLHEIHEKTPGLRALIERSIGSSEAYPTIRRRGAFLRVAEGLGIRVPMTRAVTRESDLDSLGDNEPGVLKLDGTWGGSGVAIVHTRAEAITAFWKLSRPMGASVAWKRWLVNRDPLALWSWRRRETPSVTIQEFVPGRPANSMFVCLNGEILSMVTVEVVTAQGATGAATVVRLVRNAEVDRAARLLVKELHLSGFHGLDFMIEDETGKAYLIELNPRCTQLGHLRIAGQGDLAGVMSAKLHGESVYLPPREDCIQGDTIAFFPQTFNWNPKSVYLRQGYHDVPWEEPELLRELFRNAWPQRQLLSRIYHHFRVTQRQEEMKFSAQLVGTADSLRD